MLRTPSEYQKPTRELIDRGRGEREWEWGEGKRSKKLGRKKYGDSDSEQAIIHRRSVDRASSQEAHLHRQPRHWADHRSLSLLSLSLFVRFFCVWWNWVFFFFFVGFELNFYAFGVRIWIELQVWKLEMCPGKKKKKRNIELVLLIIYIIKKNHLIYIYIWKVMDFKMSFKVVIIDCE